MPGSCNTEVKSTLLEYEIKQNKIKAANGLTSRKVLIQEHLELSGI